MSMVGVELTKFINPNLTWKTSSKGRSASRRPRKLKDRSHNMGEKQAGSGSRAGDASTSDSEKMGATVLGRCLRDKVKHVPIKKRRFLFRSPSPPPSTPSPCQEYSEELVNCESAVGQCASSISVSKERVKSVDAATSIKPNDFAADRVFSENISELTRGKHVCSEDLSGIEMLVAVACNDGMVDDLATKELLVREEIDASSSTVPSKATVAIANKSALEDDLNGSAPYLFAFPAGKDDEAERESVPSHVDRSNWDLNTVMDAWDNSCANHDNDSEARDNSCANHDDDSETRAVNTIPDDGMGSKNTVNVGDCEMPTGSEDGDATTVKSPTQSKILGDGKYGFHVPSASGGLSFDSVLMSGHEGKFASSANQISVQKKSFTTLVKAALEPLSLSCYGSWTSTQIASTDIRLNFSSNAESNENQNPAPSGDVIETGKNRVSELNLGETYSLEKTPEKQNLFFTESPGSGASTMGKEGSKFASLLHDKIFPMLSTDKHQSPGSSERDYLSAPVVSVGEGEQVLVNDLTGKGNKALEADMTGSLDKSYLHSTSTVGDDCEFAFHEPCTSFADGPGSSRKVPDMEELNDVRNHSVGSEKMSEIQEGYDSQYEDGELRESLVQCLEDIEVGETEEVDYESDERDAYDTDDAGCTLSFKTNTRESLPATDHEVNKKDLVKPSKILSKLNSKSKAFELEMDMDVWRGRSKDRPADLNGKNEQSSKGNDPGHVGSLKPKWSGWDQQPPESCVVTSEMAGGKNGSVMSQVDGFSARPLTPSEVIHGSTRGHLDASDGNISSRVVDLRESRRALQPCYEGPSSNLLEKNRNPRMQLRSDDRGEFCIEEERGRCGSVRAMGRARSSSHMRGRGRMGSRLDDRRWNPRAHNFCTYEKQRPRSIVINTTEPKVEDASLPVYRSFVRRRSPAKVHNEYAPHRLSPRPGRYPQRLSPKEGYFRSLDEPFARMHNLSRRERSFSPMFPRGDVRFHPHDRYRSGSRSTSPLPRHHNPGLRPLSRSPDFRSEARIERLRMPVRKQDFESDYEAEFVSPPPRRRTNARWVDERGRAGDEFRSRRLSPARIFRQGHRFGSPGRLKPDEYYNRPVGRGGRFSSMGCGGRGRKDGDDEVRRKAGNRYHAFEPMRRRFEYDTDGFVGGDHDEKEECIGSVQKRSRGMSRGPRERGFEGEFSEW